MSITSTYLHGLDDGLETYSFPTEIRQTKYRHLIDRLDDGPWQIWPLETEGAMSVDTARAYVREVNELIEFAEKLNRPAPRRTTEPGQPAFEETI